MPAMNQSMRGPNRALIIGGVLVVLCGTYWLRYQGGPAAASASIDAGPGLPNPESVARAPADVRFRAPGPIRRDPFSSAIVFPPRPDPIAPRNTEQAQPAPDPHQVALNAARRELHLTAIVMAQTPVAIINGVAYSAGDTVKGFVIKRISPRSIVLEREGARVLISVP